MTEFVNLSVTGRDALGAPLLHSLQVPLSVVEEIHRGRAPAVALGERLPPQYAEIGHVAWVSRHTEHLERQ